MSARKYAFIVDDDRCMLKGMERLLAASGYKTRLFDSAGALLSRGDFSQGFCVILDIDLGDGSGIDLCRRLTHGGIVLPIIYVTGNDSETTRAAAMESGCVAFLIKPFTAKALLESVERAAAAAELQDSLFSGRIISNPETDQGRIRSGD